LGKLAREASIGAERRSEPHFYPLRANKVLFHAGDPGDGCYRVDEGLLKVVMVSRTGSERILAFLGPGAIVGELSIWGATDRICDCRARCSTELPQSHRV
jgi:CRP-like cAMP-binding protein